MLQLIHYNLVLEYHKCVNFIMNGHDVIINTVINVWADTETWLALKPTNGLEN